MTDKQIELKLKKFFKDFFYEEPISIKKIKGGVSDRKVYKINSKSYICIGVNNSNLKENNAFISFSESFRKSNLNVPEIYLISENKDFYLEEYLGNKTLYDELNNKVATSKIKLQLSKKVLSDLIKFQILGKNYINFNLCYETKIFDKKQIFFDFNKFYNYYFKDYANILLMDKTLNVIKNILLKKLIYNKNYFFMYRDFQPRNIIVRDNELYYIDYQSGRKGPLQYDVASFLYSGSIELSPKERSVLLNFYLKELAKYVKINNTEFKESFYYFAFIRLLQILGSYGYTFSKTGDKRFYEKMNKANKKIIEIRPKLKDKTINEFAKLFKFKLN